MKRAHAFAMVRGFDGPERREVLGEAIGPFVIYSDADLSSRGHVRGIDYYHVTHAATGYSTAKSRAKNKARAMARSLAACGADWAFEDVEAVRMWPMEWVNAVRAIRANFA